MLIAFGEKDGMKGWDGVCVCVCVGGEELRMRERGDVGKGMSGSRLEGQRMD